MSIPKEGPGSLKPRAVAVLCSLRSGPKTTVELARAIGDASVRARGTKEATRDLMDSMLSLGLVKARNDERSLRWYLTHDGLGWLQSNGLDACHEVRLWVRDEGNEP